MSNETMSPTDVLQVMGSATLEFEVRAARNHPDRAPYQVTASMAESARATSLRLESEMRAARAAVAALIEREAALTRDVRKLEIRLSISHGLQNQAMAERDVLSERVKALEATVSNAEAGPHDFCDENGCAYSLAGKAECGAHCCRLLTGELEARNG